MIIAYRPGKEMSLADVFSRLPNKRLKEAIDLDIKVYFVQFSAQKLAQIQQAINADPNNILRGWPDAFKAVSKDMGPCWPYRDELAIENGILLKGERIIIPKFMQKRYFTKFTMAIRESKSATSTKTLTG